MLTDQELQSLRNMGNEAEAAADEIVRLRAELQDFEADDACEERCAKLQRENDKLRAALRVAVRQNEHDMLMTGDELRDCREALGA